MAFPAFSILMPSYNSEKYIEAAIKSVLPQLNEKDEIVIQDGGSTDRTVEIIKNVGEEDARIKLVSERDSGQSDALNKALCRAKNEYVLWLNSDDIIVPTGLESLRNTISGQRTNPIVVFGSHQTLRASGSVIAQYEPKSFEFDKVMRRGCYVFSGSIAISRQFLLDLGGFSTQYDFCMDLELFLRMLSKLDAAPVRCPGVIGALRWHDESKSGTAGMSFIADGWKVRGDYVSDASDRVARVVVAGRQTLAVVSTPIRHSRFYNRIRGSVRG